MGEQSQHDPWASGRLTSAQLDAALGDLEGLAVPPIVAAAALAALEQPGGDGDALGPELLAIVRCDPAFTVRVLSLAAARGVPTATVESAVAALGAEAVRCELLAACTLAEFPEVKVDRPIPEPSQPEACRTRLDEPAAAEPIPLSEYRFDNYLWRLDPFEISAAYAGNPRVVFSPEDFLVAYWMGRLHGLLGPEQ